MASKVIKLTDNNDVTLLPVSDSAYIQHMWREGKDEGKTITSVKDALNNVIDRVDVIEPKVHDDHSDLQNISYSTSAGIILSNGGNLKLAGAGSVSISYTNNVLTFTGVDNDSQTQKLSGEYRTTSKTAYVKLSGDTNTEVGFYDAGGGTSDGTATVTLSYEGNGKRGIGIKVTYTDTKYTHPSFTSTGTATQNKNVTGTSGQQNVVTGITINSNGHVTGYTYANIYSTNTVFKGSADASSTHTAATTTDSSQMIGVIQKIASTNGTSFNTTQYVGVPSKQYVDDAINSGVNNALTSVLKYKGTIGTNGTVTTLPASHKVGDVYTVKTAGTFAGQSCEVGDYIICNTEGSTANDAHWDVINGENQVENKNLSLTIPGDGTSVNGTIATVDGTDIKITASHGQSTKSSKEVTASGNESLTHNSSLVITNISYTVDANGHIGTITATTGKLPTVPAANVTSKLVVSKTSKGSTSAASSTSDTTYITNVEGASGNSTVGMRGDGTWIGVSYTNNGLIKFDHIGPSITSGSQGPTAAKTFDISANNQTFVIPRITYDAHGHLTAATQYTYTIPKITTSTVLKSISLDNNNPVKYALLTSSGADINETWLKTVTGLSDSVDSSTYILVTSNSTSSISVSTDTSLAYVKIV